MKAKNEFLKYTFKVGEDQSHQEFDEEAYHEYLRTYAAIQALQGILSNNQGLEKISTVSGSDNPDNLVKNTVWLAVNFADKLLEELNKKSI